MQYRGMVATAFGIVREEGALRLWQGVTPALYRHVVYRWAKINIHIKYNTIQSFVWLELQCWTAIATDATP